MTMNQFKKRTIMLETYKKVKKLEKKIETDLYLESEIERSEPLSSYLQDNPDGSTWYGADVLIVYKLTKEMRDWGLRSPSRSIVKTKHAEGLAWLFTTLGKIFSQEIDSVNKYFFYADLAGAANTFLRRTDFDCDLKDLLLEVVRSSKRYL